MTSRPDYEASEERIGLFGHLTLMAFVILSVLMATVVVYQENRLTPRERQLLEVRR